ncbi:hypothetical protein CsSME_00043999 [Camellia sinensis var. sinensis]
MSKLQRGVEDTAKINSQKMDTLLAPVMVYGTTVPPVVGDTAYAALAASSDPAKMDPLFPCPSTLLLSNKAFNAISRFPNAKINVEYAQ